MFFCSKCPGGIRTVLVEGNLARLSARRVKRKVGEGVLPASCDEVLRAVL